jgi:hypothetical protein
LFKLLIELGPKVAKLPESERQIYRDKIDEVFRLLDQAIIIVMNRLGILLSISEDQKPKFIEGLRQLYNVTEWNEIEGVIMLCKPIREAIREMEAFWGKAKSELFLKNPDNVISQLQNLTSGRFALASYIADSLRSLAEMADTPDQDFKKMQGAVKAKYDELREKRRQLVLSESNLFDAV